MSQEIYTRVCEAIKDRMGDKLEMSEKSLIQEDLGMTSIQMVMLLTKLTGELKINLMEFTDYELRRVKTVGDLSELLTFKQNIE